MKTKLNENDLKISEGLKKKINSAYKEFINRYSDLIFRECVRCCHDEDEAQDLLNEILFKIFTQIDQFNVQRGSFATWVANIYRHHLADYARNVKLKPELLYRGNEFFDFYSEDVVHKKIADDETIRDKTIVDKIASIKSALSELNERDRLILQYRSDNMSYKEISEMLNISSEAAMTARSRAVKKIKEIYFKEMEKHKVR